MQCWTAAAAASRAGSTPALREASRARRQRLQMPQWQQWQRPWAGLFSPSALDEPEAGWNERHMTEKELLAEKKWQKRWDQVIRCCEQLGPG